MPQIHLPNDCQLSYPSSRMAGPCSRTFHLCSSHMTSSCRIGGGLAASTCIEDLPLSVDRIKDQSWVDYPQHGLRRHLRDASPQVVDSAMKIWKKVWLTLTCFQIFIDFQLSWMVSLWFPFVSPFLAWWAKMLPVYQKRLAWPLLPCFQQSLTTKTKVTQEVSTSGFFQENHKKYHEIRESDCKS